jgi:hypothetical protein
MGLGSSKAPAATNWADVMVVSGSLRVLKLSHDAASAGAVARTTMSNTLLVPITLGSQFLVEVIERFSTVLFS